VFVLPKPLSLPGLYIINKISYLPSPSTDSIVATFFVTDSYTRTKRTFRFDVISIAPTKELAEQTINHFINTGKLRYPTSNLSYHPTPPKYKQSLTIVTFDKIRNQPCLVRYTYAGQNIGMLFFPHEFSF
jgi:hypothetical protein